MPFETINNLSADTTNLLKEVIKRKKKKDNYEGLRNKSLIIGSLTSITLIVFIIIDGIATMPDPFIALATMFSNKLHVLLFVISASFFVYFFYFQERFKKEKEKLKKVTREVIDHLNNTTNMNLQDKASEIKEIMNEKYNINLYVKNK